MIGVWLMTPSGHWWLKNLPSDEEFFAFVAKHYDRLQTGHYFERCRAVYANGYGGKCDLRAKWGHSLRDYSDEQLSELFVKFRLTMLEDERFAEWLVRCNVDEIVAVTSL